MPTVSDFLGIDFTNARAQDVIAAVLKMYGIDDPEAINEVYSVGKEAGDDAAYLALRQTKAYKAAFPGMQKRAENKLSPMNEQQYLDWQSSFTSVMRNNGIPSGFYDSPDDFANLIGNDIDPDEIKGRVVKGVVAARSAPQEVKDALLNFYGIDEGHLAAYWLDPSPNRGAKLLQEQAATYVGAAATRAKYAGLTATEAETIASQGRSIGDVEQSLSDLTQGSQLLDAIPGEAETKMTREEQIAYAGGNSAATEELKRRAAKRKAQFAGGGGFAESAQGVTGLADQG